MPPPSLKHLPPETSISTRFIPGINLCSHSMAQTSNGTIYISGSYHESNSPSALKISLDNTATYLPWWSETVIKDIFDNVYFASRGSIEKISASGIQSTLAGREAEDIWDDQDADGTGIEARFHSIKAIATDNAGNVYVLEQLTPRVIIRKINNQGEVTTILKTPVKEINPATENGITGYTNAFTADREGNLYLGTANGVLRISPDYSIHIFAGYNKDQTYHTTSPTNQNISKKFTSRTISLTTDDKNIYVNEGRSIHKISKTGTISTLYQSTLVWPFKNRPPLPDLIDGRAEGHSLPIGSAIDVDKDGSVYYVDCYNNAIRKITKDGNVLTVVRSEFIPWQRNGSW